MSSINDFARALADVLEVYSSETAEAAKAAIDEVAAGAEKAVKEHISFKQRTGKYVKALRVVTSHDGLYDRRKTLYAKSPHYRLTHLLEHGHLSRDGTTRVKPYPHFIYGEEYVEENLERTVQKHIEQIGR